MSRAHIFLSYSRVDERIARALERALEKRKLTVWRDVRSIAAGTRWSIAIENAIRESRGVVVLVTAASTASDWVTYEYAFATGARIPVVAVVIGSSVVPGPLKEIEVVEFSQALVAAEKIDEGITKQSRSARQVEAVAPQLMAKFREENGELCPALDADEEEPPSLWIDLWIEHSPAQTKSVAFEILDVGFRDRKWSVSRKKREADSLREFLTDEMNSYGDVEIWARGIGSGKGNWLSKSTLYEALVRHYTGRSKSRDVSSALKQIREN